VRCAKLDRAYAASTIVVKIMSFDLFNSALTP
jgi:hypothetical protein